MKKENKKIKSAERAIISEAISMLLYVVVVVLLTYLVITYVGQRTKVSGESMEPTLSDKDNLIVDKITYRFRDPERYDIIVFPYEYEEDTYYIKRIMGLPGETVRIGNAGDIYINGEILEESYGLEVIRNPGTAKEEITLGSDEYFVLGDNRNDSKDSRDSMVGVIHRERIVGKAWVRIYPLNKIGFIRHK